MRTKRILGIVVFIILIIPASLLLTGCQQSDSSYGVKVTGESSGGAFAFYQDKSGGSLYVQKISADGKLLWGEDGIRLNP